MGARRRHVSILSDSYSVSASTSAPPPSPLPSTHPVSPVPYSPSPDMGRRCHNDRSLVCALVSHSDEVVDPARWAPVRSGVG